MARILIVAPNWIGDTLLARPLFARLRQRLPGALLHAVAPSWTAPVLARTPEIDQVIETDFQHGELRLRDRWRLGRELRRGGYQQAVVLPNSFKSALIPFFADIPLRSGFAGEWRYGLLNIVHKLDEDRLPLMADRYAQLAEKPGDPVSPRLAVPRLRVDEANLLIAVSRMGLDRSRPVAVFCPGAEYGPAKRWPAAHFAALARGLAERGMSIWLMGSKKDHEIAEEISRLSGRVAINLCGRTDLGSAIDLMSVARWVVANDSGLMHVAAALGRPLIALYGSSSPAHTPPLAQAPELARIVKLPNIECSPCFQRVCPLGHFRCMMELAPERVLNEMERLQPA
jgi:heptosyltransferase-2